MKFLISAYLAMAVYGLFAGYVGAALIALLVAGFTRWGSKHLDKREQEFNASPRSARPPAHTVDELGKWECESSRSEL